MPPGGGGGFHNEGFYGDNLVYGAENRAKMLKRSSSAASHYIAASRLSLNEAGLHHQHQQLRQQQQDRRRRQLLSSRLSLAPYDLLANEFEASKFGVPQIRQMHQSRYMQAYMHKKSPFALNEMHHFEEARKVSPPD